MKRYLVFVTFSFAPGSTMAGQGMPFHLLLLPCLGAAGGLPTLSCNTGGQGRGSLRKHQPRPVTAFPPALLSWLTRPLSTGK